MKNFLIITYIEFWKGGAGHISRLGSIITFLKKNTNLTIGYFGDYSEVDLKMMQKDFFDLEIIPFMVRNRQDIPLIYNEFSIYIRSRDFDVVLFEYVEMSFLANLFPPQTIKILDTHDLIVSKIESFKQFGIKYSGLDLTLDQELSIYSEFDYIVLISSKDYNELSKWISHEKLLLIPHALSVTRSTIRQDVFNISFIASAYSPNVDGIVWFLENVWPSIHKQNIKLNVFGHILNVIDEKWINQSNVQFHGFINDLEKAYSLSDIIINPVRAGAGLKIKNVEALARGLPLLTTPHGLSGLENVHPNGAIMANTEFEFIKSLNQLIHDYPLRLTLANFAFKYAKENFQESVCFEQLQKILR